MTLAAGTRGYLDPPTSLEDTPLVLRKALPMAPKTGFTSLVAPGLLAWFRRARYDFDMVHLHFARDLVQVPLAALVRRSGLPFVLQPHGMVQPGSNALAPAFDSLAVRSLLRDASRVCYLTEHERDCLDRVSMGGANLTELPNGVPLYPPAEHAADSPEVLFLARLHPRKRAMDFVNAALELGRRGLAARFTLVGPDEGDGPRVRAATETSPDIRWEGALPTGEGPKRMRDASIYVLPSVNEPYPMAVLEAMSVGLPVVVTTDCGLAPIVARHECGVVIEPGADNLANALETLLKSPALMRDMGSRGRAAVESELGMLSVGDSLERIYDDAMNAMPERGSVR